MVDRPPTATPENLADGTPDSYQVIDPNLSDEMIADAVMLQMFGTAEQQPVSTKHRNLSKGKCAIKRDSR